MMAWLIEIVKRVKYIFQKHARGRKKRYYDWAHHTSEYVGISMLGELDFFIHIKT